VDFYSHWKIAQFILVAEIEKVACLLRRQRDRGDILY
jgi:hypothetical protein